MCGIIGVISKSENGYEIIRYGLKKLEYRGYDSAGFSYLLNKEIIVNKCKGDVDTLFSKYNKEIPFNLGIGHVRWATIGATNDINAHPHLSYHKKVCLVHNGIIENYKELKDELINAGYEFKSETDSEIIANYLEYYYMKGYSFLDTLKLTSEKIKGNYAIAVILNDESDRLYFYKRRSPLLIGTSDKENLLASDVSSINKYCNDFINLEDDRFGYITNNEIKVYNFNGEEKIEVYTKEYEESEDTLGSYENHMLKEIEETPLKLKILLEKYYTKNNYNFTKNLLDTFKNTDYITFIGCGTSYNAETVMSYLTNEKNIPNSVHIASEWAYYPIYHGKNPLFVFLSQSGETMDLIKCLDIVKEKGYKTLLITNSENSTLAHKSDFVIPLYSGKEIAVASTKVYVTMIAAYLLLLGAVYENNDVVKEIETAIDVINDLISKKEQIKDIALQIKDKEHVFFLGRGYDYATCMEASLKLKEISYIHSEAIPAGELKHGPIALIEKGTPVFCFLTDKLVYDILLSNVNEVVSRGAEVYLITNHYVISKDKQYHEFIIKDASVIASCLIKPMFGFYLAYYTSYVRGLNIDKPRNLAKSVTVE